jgi:hypothetical protein
MRQPVVEVARGGWGGGGGGGGEGMAKPPQTTMMLEDIYLAILSQLSKSNRSGGAF